MIAYDFYRIVPPGVGLIGVTCMIEGWQGDAYTKGLERVEECARELARRKCDFIIHAGVPLVVSQGIGFERELVGQIERLANVPATTSIVAGMAALQAISAQRIGLVNPYPPDLNDAVVKFLTRNDFDVRAVVSLGADFTRIGAISEADVYSAAKQAVKQAPDIAGLYLPCPQFPALDVIEAIESDFGVAVVGHLPSEIWAALKSLGIRQPIRGFGKLLSTV
ncbi:MAG: maleate cis-trans isomerase family protein [Pyrinomonadaceae bacterium]